MLRRRPVPGPFTPYRVGRYAYLIDCYKEPWSEHNLMSKREAVATCDRLNRLFHEEDGR